MVQVVENRTDLEGVVVSRTADPERPGYDLLEIDVEKTSPVPGFADLLSSRVGSRVAVGLKHDLVPEGNLEGAVIRCRAFLAGPGVVLADRDPPSDTFSILPPG